MRWFDWFPLGFLALAILCGVGWVGVLAFVAVRAILGLWPNNPVSAVFYGTAFGCFVFGALAWLADYWRQRY
jgi:hypothetical protein